MLTPDIRDSVSRFAFGKCTVTIEDENGNCVVLGNVDSFHLDHTITISRKWRRDTGVYCTFDEKIIDKIVTGSLVGGQDTNIKVSTKEDKMAPSVQSKTDAQWQKESDARTLAEAEAIKADAARLKGAQNAAKKMTTEKQKEAQAMSKVAGKSTTKSTSRKK